MIESDAPDAGTCQFLSWDSEWFGRRIARVVGNRLTDATVADIRAWVDRERPHCMYFLADIDDERTLRLAAETGFQLVDLRVTLDTTPNEALAGGAPDGMVVRPFLAGDLAHLEPIARSIYDRARFLFDPRFPRDAARGLYALWLRKSCEGQADIVLVAELEGRAMGYVTCHRDAAGEGRIGLVGVSGEVHGRGIGRALVSLSLRWFFENGCRRVSVVTQGSNIPAQRLYLRCGFATRSIRAWYHRWCDERGHQ